MSTAQQTHKKPDSAKPAVRSGARRTASKPTRRSTTRNHNHMPEIPGWAATIASMVGVGVAVGVGLYATRRQWLPKAESWGEELNDRFTDLRDKYRGHASNDHDDYDFADDADGNWNSETELSDAHYPAACPAA